MNSNREVKRVLLIFADSSVKRGLADAGELQKLLSQAAEREDIPMEVYVTYARSLSYFVSNTRSVIYDHKNRMGLEEYDFVYFRKAGTVMQQMLSCAIYLREHGIPFYDQEILRAGSRNKLSQMFKLSSVGVPIPATLFCRHKLRLLRLLRTKYASDMHFPLIAKATGGTRGSENFLVKTPEELYDIMKNRHRHFLIQEFIPNEGDYRVLVMNGQVKGLIKRQAGGDSHLNNTSKGGSAAWLPTSELSEVCRADAVYAAVALFRDFAGVDVIIDKQTGKHYVLEVNRAPQVEGASFPEKKAGLLVHAFADAIDIKSPRPSSMISNGVQKRLIGRFEKVTVADYTGQPLVAKIDSGADSSSIHCDYIQEMPLPDGRRELRYSFGPGHEQRTADFGVTKVRSSTGHEETRYTVQIPITIGVTPFIVKASLSSREQMRRPMLLGRRFLRDNGLVVDVSRRYVMTVATN